MLKPISKLSILFLSCTLVMGCVSTETYDTSISTEPAASTDSDTAVFVPDDVYEEINDEPSADYFLSFTNDDFALRSLLGEWEAISKNHQSICGDMTIDTAVISFANKGDVSFEIVIQETDHWILKISEDVDAGTYMRLGPITQTEEDTEEKTMEVAYYDSKEMAVAPREEATDNANSWGVYGKKLK